MFNVGIIGCGDMGEAHAAAWTSRPDAKVVAVCDAQESRREKLAAACGAKGYGEYRQALEHPGLQIVSVCTPVCMHAEVAALAAQRGCHVLVEKPIALTLEQADAMIRAASENRIRLSVSFQYRAFSRMVRYREMVRAGEFGGPVFFRFTDVREVRPKLAMHRKSMNGGPLVDMAAHYFDLVRYFTGEEPRSIFARGHVFGSGKPRLADVDDFAIDAASIEVGYGGGHTLSAFINWGMPEGFTVISEEMLIGPSLCARTCGNDIETIHGAQTARLALPANPPGPSARIDDLIQAIDGKRPLQVTAQDGRIALQCSLAALESIETGKVVHLHGGAPRL